MVSLASVLSGKQLSIDCLKAIWRDSRYRRDHNLYDYKSIISLSFYLLTELISFSKNNRYKKRACVGCVLKRTQTGIHRQKRRNASDSRVISVTLCSQRDLTRILVQSWCRCRRWWATDQHMTRPTSGHLTRQSRLCRCFWSNLLTSIQCFAPH